MPMHASCPSARCGYAARLVVLGLCAVAVLLPGEVYSQSIATRDGDARGCPTLGRPSDALSKRAMEDIPDAKPYILRDMMQPHASFEGGSETLRVAFQSSSRRNHKMPMPMLLKHIAPSGTSAEGKPQYSRRNLTPLLEHIISATPGEGFPVCPCAESRKGGSRVHVRVKRVSKRVGWADIKLRQDEMLYLGSLVDLSTFSRRIYIDGGSRQYDSSVGSWFKSIYPEAETFQTYAFDVDSKFSSSYIGKTDVQFHQCALWIRDTTIHLGGMEEMMQISDLGDHSLDERYAKKKQINGAHSVKAMDTAEFLQSAVKKNDFVVMKLDIEGAEFEVIDHLIHTGAIFLIDELFLECHDDAWSGMRVDKKRGDCVVLLHRLRSMGMWVHDWF